MPPSGMLVLARLSKVKLGVMMFVARWFKEDSDMGKESRIISWRVGKGCAKPDMCRSWTAEKESSSFFQSLDFFATMRVWFLFCFVCEGH